MERDEQAAEKERYFFFTKAHRLFLVMNPGCIFRLGKFGILFVIKIPKMQSRCSYILISTMIFRFQMEAVSAIDRACAP
jgi:hypothetical protein